MKTITQSTLSGGASVLASLGKDSRGGSRGRSPHRYTMLVVLIFVATLARAATNDLSGLLQKGLFEEEANRNLDAATTAYQTLVLQFDKDRQIGATAIFRLGEVYRKQGKTNEAAAQYDRIVRDFTEQTTLVTLSRQNLAGLNKRSDNLESRTSSKDSEPDLAQLKKLPRAELLQVLPTLVPDQLLTKLLEQLQTTQTKQAELRQDMGSDHPEIKRLIVVEKTLHEQIDQRVTGILKALELRSSGSGKQNATVTTVADEEGAEIRRIQAMIQNSPDLINAPGSGGFTPLHTAADAGRLTVARFLLDNGANVNGKNSAGETPLTLAAASGHKAMVELLLSRDADVNAQGKAGYTALHQAALNGFRGVVEVLLANKASVDSRSKGQETPLHLAATAGHSDLSEFLIRRGADVNATAASKSTPLILAAMRGHALAVKTLVTGKASPNLQDNNGRTALSHAAERKHLEVVKALLDAKTDPNAGEHDLPLLAAVRGGQFEIAEALLRADADPNRAGKSTVEVRTPGSGSAGFGSNQGSFGPYLPLQVAVRDGNVAMVKLLLKFKADPNAKEMSWFNPPKPLIFYALSDVEMFEAFLDGGADPDSKGGNDQPLIVAAANWDSAKIQLLLAHHANVNTRGEYDMTPLHVAVERGEKKTVELLLNAKANVNAQTTTDSTPLHWAVNGGRKDLVELLLANGADTNLRDNTGQTPLDYLKPKQSPQPGMPFGVPPRSLRSPPEDGRVKPEELASLLRQHGALDDLPDFNSIRVTRAGLSPIVVFVKDTNSVNRFKLLEVVRNFYRSSGDSRGLPFPDFSKIIIQRPATGKPGAKKEITANLLTVTNSFDCAKDTWLEFGDVVEIPEREHTLAEQPRGATEAQLEELSQCLEGKVTFVVRGQKAELKLDGTAYTGWLQLALGRVQNLLRSSSDLSRIKIKRTDTMGKAKEIIADSKAAQKDNVWLRDGDVIEVPDKP